MNMASGSTGFWGLTIEIWDRLCVIGFWLTAITGGIAVFGGLFTAVVGHKISDVTQAQSQAQIAEANARSAEADARSAEAHARSTEAELKLEELRRQVGHRQLQRDAFLEELRGQQSEPVEILYLRDDPECFDLAQQIARALETAGWKITDLAPIPVPRSNIDPTAMSVDGQPSGVTIVAASMTEAELRATQMQAMGERGWAHTPFTALTSAVLRGLGRVSSRAAGPHAPNGGTLRVVVAPR
ncbi:hypothetical protein [Burkholderia ubonensis]|uniref:hypothetical protein n=1 Tax=Burkholderia ubonensis TaxID=101571 RepID=UPI0012FC12F4|nr:hypothetical protein [Burkholderia ubonensis]